MNKKGDKILSVYWFAILLIVAGGIFAMVSIFYNNPLDVREIEGTLLTNKIADCISTGGKLDLSVFDESFKDYFLERCHLTLLTEKEFNWEENSQYYIGLEIYDVNDIETSLVAFTEGNLNLLSSCELQKDEDYERLAKCVDKKFYSVGEDDSQYLIKILSIVRKSEKNVK